MTFGDWDAAAGAGLSRINAQSARRCPGARARVTEDRGLDVLFAGVRDGVRPIYGVEERPVPQKRRSPAKKLPTQPFPLKAAELSIAPQKLAAGPPTACRESRAAHRASWSIPTRHAGNDSSSRPSFQVSCLVRRASDGMDIPQFCTAAKRRKPANRRAAVWILTNRRAHQKRCPCRSWEPPS